MAEAFPQRRLRCALMAYSVLMWCALPLIIAYLWWRGRKDPLYAQHLGERFGRYGSAKPGAVWIHAVSLGEMRSATPLIRTILDRGEHVVTTHFTPAGRREAIRQFPKEIESGHLRVVWVPLEYGFSYAGFLRSFRPKFGLVMEIEIWPRMIMAARAAGVPLFMCNAQYPTKSYEKDKGGVRAMLLTGFAGGFVKSQQQMDRFADAGMQNIHVTGELRFDQPIPPAHLAAAAKVKSALTQSRPTMTLASVVEGEDDTYIAMIQQNPDTFFVYVPRAPERFDDVAAMLDATGITYERRSEVLSSDLGMGAAPDVQVLLGDSMGEMYFYLALCDRAIVGGGFVTKGAHNIIEPLALKKPVIVGPHIWTIEHPATEAIAAGVCHHVLTPDALQHAVANPKTVTDEQIATFFETHAGGVDRTIAAIETTLPNLWKND